MKGLIFEAFISHVEESCGVELVEQMIEESQLPNAGAYTAVGTYDANEFVTMLTKLSQLLSRDASQLLREFGQRLFHVLAETYPDLIASSGDAFALITVVDRHIHREVEKLYPEADLPRFTHEFLEPDLLRFVYVSERGFTDLAHGLIAGCAAHFGENIEIEVESLGQHPDPQAVFLLRRIRPDD